MVHVDVVVGGQFGSEGKGHVTAQLIARTFQERPDADVVNIRVAGPNAGHTVYDEAGNRFALRSVPVGAAVNDNVQLYIASGSEVEIPVLQSEIELLRSKGHPVRRLSVSGEATVLTEGHKQREQELDMSGRLGSTAKGIGAARADRIMRVADRIKDNPEALATLDALGVHVVNDPGWLNEVYMRSVDQVVIEGTQGYGLGLHAGHYPQCTSSSTRAIDFLAMAGVSPWHPEISGFNVWVCARVYPIRVAGNSGALEGETSWEELGLAAEHTTVTNKVRRVGEWDPELIHAAVTANGGGNFGGAVKIALTMADQKVPQIGGASGAVTEDALHPELGELVRSVTLDAGAPVGMVTTSPTTALFLTK